MFRPDRIGTPVIHTLDDTRTATTWAPNMTALAAQDWNVNCANAVPVLDFGRTSITWNGTTTAVVANGTIINVGQQFTITKPISGDTVGIEVNGAIDILVPENIPIIPVFGRLATAAFSTLGGVAGAESYTPLDEAKTGPVATATAAHRQHWYRQQVINNATDPSGTYFHGFQFINGSGASWQPTRMRAQFSVRQLNDQQNIGYRDTRR